jgi:hypothetical protein
MEGVRGGVGVGPDSGNMQHQTDTAPFKIHPTEKGIGDEIQKITFDRNFSIK